MTSTDPAIHLTNDQATATVHLDGGRLASLAVGGLELLVTDGPKPTRWGSFPMIPWCGRLPFGKLAFDGNNYDFPITSGDHANHGRTHLQSWSVESASDTELAIRTELSEHWPFGGHVVQTYTLTDNSLTVLADVHAADRAMPAMIGWHPWFRRDLGTGGEAELSFTAESIYVLDDNDIPTGELAPVPEGPWDNCFVGLDGDPVISWPGAIDLTVSSTFDHWVIYTQPEHALCVEPQTGPPNQFHLDPHLLSPGEALSGSMTLHWTTSGNISPTPKR